MQAMVKEGKAPVLAAPSRTRPSQSTLPFAPGVTKLVQQMQQQQLQGEGNCLAVPAYLGAGVA